MSEGICCRKRKLTALPKHSSMAAHHPPCLPGPPNRQVRLLFLLQLCHCVALHLFLSPNGSFTQWEIQLPRSYSGRQRRLWWWTQVMRTPWIIPREGCPAQNWQAYAGRSPWPLEKEDGLCWGQFSMKNEADVLQETRDCEAQGAKARLNELLLIRWIRKPWLWCSKNSQEKVERRERRAMSRWTSPRFFLLHVWGRTALEGALSTYMGLVSYNTWTEEVYSWDDLKLRRRGHNPGWLESARREEGIKWTWKGGKGNG